MHAEGGRWSIQRWLWKEPELGAAGWLVCGRGSSLVVRLVRSRASGRVDFHRKLAMCVFSEVGAEELDHGAQSW